MAAARLVSKVTDCSCWAEASSLRLDAMISYTTVPGFKIHWIEIAGRRLSKWTGVVSVPLAFWPTPS